MRTPEQIAAGYKTFRGQCKVLSDAAVKADPTLTLVRGHIFVPGWPSEPEQAHWWCKRQDGTILDPSWEQFPFHSPPSAMSYTEFDGTFMCDNCGESFKEGAEDSSHESRYSFCSHRCHGKFVGIY